MFIVACKSWIKGHNSNDHAAVQVSKVAKKFKRAAPGIDFFARNSEVHIAEDADGKSFVYAPFHQRKDMV